MFLQIGFKAFPRTILSHLKRTFNFSVYTYSVVFSDVFNWEQFKAADLPVRARVLLSSSDVFQRHTPDLCEVGSACGTTLDPLSALAACGVAIRTQLYGWRHVIHANWTLKFLQQRFVESTWQIIHI
jgi:hypothetical protein